MQNAYAVIVLAHNNSHHIKINMAMHISLNDEKHSVQPPPAKV